MCVSVLCVIAAVFAVLVKLKKVNGRCVLKTPFIRPICLPGKHMTFPDHSCCKISGWGHMHESECMSFYLCLKCTAFLTCFQCIQ